jgi:hypothetical protein
MARRGFSQGGPGHTRDGQAVPHHLAAFLDLPGTGSVVPKCPIEEFDAVVVVHAGMAQANAHQCRDPDSAKHYLFAFSAALC